MAADVKMVFDTVTREWDVVLENGDLERDEGLVTAVHISLFTDRRAQDGDDYANDDPRGWWGDQISLVDGDIIGSRMWLLDRQKEYPLASIKAKEYVLEALQWMIDDDVVAKIEVDTFGFGDAYNRRLGIVIMIYQHDGDVVKLKYDDLWRKTPTIGVRP